MPGIPVYSNSPIHAAKASGITPQTADSDDTQSHTGSHQISRPSNAYPAAQPGSRPSLPAPTGSVQTFPILPPTRTQTIESTNPPAPQPGAVPVPRGGTGLPPPPKAGETFRNDQSQATPVFMPHQMVYAPLGVTETAVRRSSTVATMPIPSPMAGPLGGRLVDNLSHPPGYQQNVHAAEFNSAQRAAHEAATEQYRTLPMVPAVNEGEGVWGTAKKWAAAAGDGLASAENEVWRRINKE